MSARCNALREFKDKLTDLIFHQRQVCLTGFQFIIFYLVTKFSNQLRHFAAQLQIVRKFYIAQVKTIKTLELQTVECSSRTADNNYYGK